MATRFDPKEYAKNRLIMISSKFFPKDQIRIKSGRKGFQLGESMVTLIDRSKTIVARAQQTDEVIPLSTANIFRAGTTFQDIFQNLSDYQVISQVKSRSRRGYRKELEVVDFDVKKIELAFKKSSHPPVKTQKDEKLIKSVQKAYIKLFDENKYEEVLDDVIKRRDLFVIDDSDGKKFFDSLYRLLDNFIEKNDECKELKTKLKQIKTEIVEVDEGLKKLELEVPNFKRQIELQREEVGIFDLINKKEQLFTDPDLSLFLKILTTGLDRYIRMIERRENRTLEQRDDFLGLILEPTRYQGLNEDLWRMIVFIVETHGFELLNSKNWFKFEEPMELKQFFIKKDVLEKYASLRNIEKTLDELEEQLIKNPQYSEALNIIEEFERNEDRKVNLKREIPEIEQKIIILDQELLTERERIITYFS
ncbi:MAG: hypothetical protein ACFE95_15925 [Candidatus Hodarchaeota archaeon]